MKNNYLFIGGPRHCQIHEVLPECDTVIVHDDGRHWYTKQAVTPPGMPTQFVFAVEEYSKMFVLATVCAYYSTKIIELNE